MKSFVISFTSDTYPSYVYNSNSELYTTIENYKVYLNSLGITIKEARLISVEELEKLGCSMSEFTCSKATNLWVYSTSYWTGSAFSDSNIWCVFSFAHFDDYLYNDMLDNAFGIRPVIEIPLTEF